MRHLLLLALTLPAWGSIAYVNSSSKFSYVTQTTYTTTALSVTTGNFVIACTVANPTPDTISAADNAGNSYTALTPQARDGDNWTIFCFYKANATGNAALVVTFTATGSREWNSNVVAQYSGVATSSALDVDAKGAKNTGTSPASQSFTTTTANQVIIAVAPGSPNAVTSPLIGGSAANSRVNDSQPSLYLFDKIVSSVQTGITANATIPSAQWAIAVFSFKQADTSPTIDPVTTTDVTSHGATVHFTSSVASTGSRIIWGTSSGSWPNPITFIQDSSRTDHAWFFSGLAPSTAYFYKACSTNGTEGCSVEKTFTTAAAESGYVTLPTLPTAVSYTEPSSFTTTYTVDATCSNLQAHIDTASTQDGDNNYLISIPAGVDCVGRFTVPIRSGAHPNGNGYRMIAGAATIPTPGGRLDSTMIGLVPRIISNQLACETYDVSSPGIVSEGGLCWLDSDSTNPNAFLHFSNSGGVLVAVAMSSGTSLPGTCVVDTWFYDTDEPDAHSRVSICDYTNHWFTYYISSAPGTFDQYAALRIDTGSSRVYVRGVQLVRPYLPASYTNLLSTVSGSADQVASRHRCFFASSTTSDRIIIDRVYFDGRGYPYRSGDGWCKFQGTNIVAINSYFNEINRWRTDTAPWDDQPSAITGEVTGGPALISNNYFKNNHGNTIFFADNGAATDVMSDVTISRNDFYEDPAHNCGGLASNGHCYSRRHDIELKRGFRFLVEGNRFNGGWPVGNSGATMAFTPRPAGVDSGTGIKDLTVTSNLIAFSPQAFLITGHGDYPGSQSIATNRVNIANNVVWKSGVASDGSTMGWIYGRQFNGQVADMGLGLQNIRWDHNGLYPYASSYSGNMHSHIGDYYTYPNSRFSSTSNTYSTLAATASLGYWGVAVAASTFGTAALAQSYVSGAGTSYLFSGNAMQIQYNGPFVDGAAYPAGNYRNETHTNFTGALWQCIPCGDLGAYRPLGAGILASGSATARGYDQKDSGPDFDVFDVAQGRTRNLRALSITSSGATIYFTSPDAVACTVEYGTSSTPGTGSRTTGTASRFQSAALSGLTTATVYYYRVYGGGCPVMASGSFTTL